MTDGHALLTEMNDRSREVFRRVVESYLDTGEPVGSRTLTRAMQRERLAPRRSATSCRISSISACSTVRMSRPAACRPSSACGMFVDGMLEVGDVVRRRSRRDRAPRSAATSADVGAMLDRVGAMLSGITHGASLVLAPKPEAPIRHIEFVASAPDRALVVLVFADGQVENRLFTPPPGQTPSSMREAANFLNAIAEGRTLAELRARRCGTRSPAAGRSSTTLSRDAGRKRARASGRTRASRTNG